jgi:glycogen operon protein
MIAHGDELGRTQQGNNNGYCQDNELSWIDWDAARDNDVLTVFTASLTALRAAHPVFRRKRFFQGRPIRGSSVDDIAWLRPDGQHMTDDDWTSGHARSVAVYLNGEGIPDRDDLGERVVDDSFLLLINAHHEPVTFLLPDASYVRTWEVAVDTADPLLANTRRRRPAPGGRQRIPGRALQVLRGR